jgi:hypothetical protein
VIISLNSINELIFVIVKCCVLFEVWTDFYNSVKKSFGFKGLKKQRKVMLKQQLVKVRG